MNYEVNKTEWDVFKLLLQTIEVQVSTFFVSIFDLFLNIIRCDIICSTILVGMLYQAFYIKLAFKYLISKYLKLYAGQIPDIFHMHGLTEENH